MNTATTTTTTNAPEFSKEEIKLLQRAVYGVWQSIAPDCAFVQDSMGALEMCLESRDMYMEPEENEEVTALLRREYNRTDVGITRRHLARFMDFGV